MKTPLSKNEEIIKRISDETGYSPEVIRKIIKWFFLGIRKIMYRYDEIHIRGLGAFGLRNWAKKKLKEDPNVDLRKREFPTKKKKK
jgi:nucleoid DNA-binding protein